MRREDLKDPEGPAEEGPASETPETSPADPVGGGQAKSAGTLTVMMALPEPQRTEALEKAVNSGLAVNLQSKTGKVVKWRYGEHILEAPPTPKPFMAAHAIHLLFSAPDLVEEVA